MSDSGMLALRSVLDIPVVSPGRGSMLFALTLGSKFSVLAQWKPAIVRYKKAIPEWGLTAQCVSVRSFDVEPSFDTLMDGKEDKVFPTSPASVNARLRLKRLNKGTPMAASSVLIWRLIADCVIDNSSAAWVNDNCRAAASKPRKAGNRPLVEPTAFLCQCRREATQRPA